MRLHSESALWCLRLYRCWPVTSRHEEQRKWIRWWRCATNEQRERAKRKEQSAKSTYHLALRSSLQDRRIEMLHDLRYGLRMLLKRPGVTLIAVLSLALGIGANTAIFSLIDAVMLKSLPIHEPDRLVLFGNGEDAGVSNGFPREKTDLFSFPFYREVRQRAQTLEGVGALLSIPWTVHGRLTANGTPSDIEKLNV